MYCYLNNKFILEKNAKISIKNRSFRYGENIFETLVKRENKIIELDLHIERLKFSSEKLYLNLDISDNKLIERINKLTKKNNLENSILRIMLFRDDDSFGLSINESKNKTSLLITEEKFIKYKKEKYKKGISVKIVSTRKNSPNSISPRIKAGANYLANILAKKEAQDENFDEAIMLSQNDFIAESTSSNIFWIKNNTVFTPSLNCDIFPGITRRILLEIISDLKLKIKEGEYKEGELLNSDEAFLSFTSAGLLPITKINKMIISQNKIGLKTQKILEEFWRYYKIENPYS